MPFFTTTKTFSSPAPAMKPTRVSATPITNAATTTKNSDAMVTDTKHSLVSASLKDPKDVRAFEHGRQKAKKTARTANWREEKARARRIKSGEVIVPHIEPPSAAKRVRSGFKAPSVRPDWEEGWSVQDAEDEWMRESVEEETDGPRIVRSESGRLEVDLTNLMKPAKTRKSKRAVGDFEVLPSVRQVVALDDRWEGELEADEPWEHLSVEGDDDKGFSYAEVAAS